MAAATDRVRKGRTTPGYSAFEGTDGSGRLLGDILDAAGIRSVVVHGWELAHCVAASAVDAADRGFEAAVVPELCSELDPEGRPAVLGRLRRYGVHVVGSADALLASLAAGS